MAFPYSEGSDYAESLLSAKLLFMESVFSWYAVYTAARAEKKVKERLDQIGIENYLPLRTEYRVWSDRKKKVSVPLISGYIFVHIKEETFVPVLTTPLRTKTLRPGAAQYPGPGGGGRRAGAAAHFAGGRADLQRSRRRRHPRHAGRRDHPRGLPAEDTLYRRHPGSGLPGR